jgi:hypothetical protein
MRNVHANTRVWVLTYFEVNRYGQTAERERLYGPTLQLHEVRKIADKWITNQRMKGRPMLPQYDLVQELRA